MEGNSNINQLLPIQSLISDLRQIVEQCRNRVALNVNSELTMMYWHIGERINRDVLGSHRAEYGKQIVSTVSAQLQEEFNSKGFAKRNIHRMMQFAQQFPDIKIVTTLSTQMTWSHVVEVLSLPDDIQREFYLTLAASERWSVRRMRKEIDGMLYERTAISSKPDELIKQELIKLREEQTLSPDLVLKVPIFLNSLV